MLNLLIVCVLLVVPVFCQQTENANQFVDSILKLMKPKYKDPMSPIPIKEQTFSVDTRIAIFVRINAKVKTCNGFVNAIEGIERQGNTTVTIYDDESTRMQISLLFTGIKFNSTVQVEAMRVTYSEPMLGAIDCFGADLEVYTDGESGVRNLTHFAINRLEGLTLEVDGPRGSLLTSMRNLPLRVGIPVIKRYLPRAVHDLIELLVTDTLSKVVNKEK